MPGVPWVGQDGGRGIVAVVLLGSGTALGCGGSAVDHPPATAAGGATAAEEEATAGGEVHHRHHHHGGVTLLLALSLDTPAVSPDQRAELEKIHADLHARMEPARAAEQSLVDTLADGLVAGALDRPTVDAELAHLTSTAATILDASVDALDRLHALLTPSQRDSTCSGRSPAPPPSAVPSSPPPAARSAWDPPTTPSSATTIPPGAWPPRRSCAAADTVARGPGPDAAAATAADLASPPPGPPRRPWLRPRRKTFTLKVAA